ncbi:MAG: hypothetical protein R3B71_01610 [Candidatus Gracilibacteria bacterium]
MACSLEKSFESGVLFEAKGEAGGGKDIGEDGEKAEKLEDGPGDRHLPIAIIRVELKNDRAPGKQGDSFL